MFPRHPRTLLVLLVFSTCTQIHAQQPPAGDEQNEPRAAYAVRAGRLDLSAATPSDFEHGVILKGEWDFLPHRLASPAEFAASPKADRVTVTVPGHWNKAFAPIAEPSQAGTWRGVGTYRLRVQLPAADSPNSKAYALRLGNVHTAYRLFVDGRIVARVGDPGMDAAGTTPQFRPLVAPLRADERKANAGAQAGTREVEILIQVSGFHHRNGGLWKPPLLGFRDRFEQDFAFQVAAEWVQFGLYSGMAILFFLLFAGGRRHKELFIFGCLSASIAVRSVLTQNRALVQLWPDFDFALGYRLEYLSFVLIPPLFAALFLAMFPGPRPDRWFRLLRGVGRGTAVVGAILAAVVILTPARIYTGIFPLALLQILIAALCMLGLLARAVRRKDVEARLLTVATLVVVAATLHDDLHNRNIIESVYLATGAFAFFVLFMAGLLGYRVRRVEQERESAEARYAARSEFFSMMSHELRTPLHALLGMMQLMEETELPEPQQREYMRIMRDGGEALLALVNDILDLSRIEAGKMQYRLEYIDLRAFFEETTAGFRGQASQKGLPIVLHLDDRLPAAFSGDAFRIRQVVANLLGNALKFTAAGRIEVHCVLVDGARRTHDADRSENRKDDARAPARSPRSPDHSGAMLEIAVSDTGAGIPPASQKAIFESFRQAEAPAGKTGTAIAGTGLGLAICRRLVEGMGGEIGLESQPGRGSRFWFRLPLQPADPVAPKDARQRAGENEATVGRTGARRTGRPGAADDHDLIAHILLADDDDVSRMLLRKFLASGTGESQSRIRIDEVENGLLAFEKFRDSDARRYDLILLDMQMPEKNGIETIQAIRQLERDARSAHTPAIAVTANAMQSDIDRARAAGFDGFVSKPVKKAELRRAVFETLLAARED